MGISDVIVMLGAIATFLFGMTTRRSFWARPSPG